MKREALLAPSILSADMSCLGQEIQAVEKAGADWLHIDVMDGHFVPNLTFGPWVVETLRPLTRLPLDCHLMVSEPEKWIKPFATAGATTLTVHAEASYHLDRLIHQIHEAGCQAGISINPATPLAQIEEVLDIVDLVLVMSVNPGFGGQKFIEGTVTKIERLVQLRGDRKFLIEIDGGVSEKNIRRLARAGVDIFVAGSAVFSSKDRKAAIEKLRAGLTGV